MDSDKTIGEGIGMRLNVDGKRTLVIGLNGLELRGREVPDGTD